MSDETVIDLEYDTIEAGLRRELATLTAERDGLRETLSSIVDARGDEEEGGFDFAGKLKVIAKEALDSHGETKETL